MFTTNLIKSSCQVTDLFNCIVLDVYFVAGDVGQLCNGDSGGPLMWKNPANGRHIILGK